MAETTVGVASLQTHLGDWKSGNQSAYAGLAERLKVLIHDGRVPLGAALPSERHLATALGVSRTTITAAYTELRDEGYLQSKQGAKSTVTLPPGAKPTGFMFPASRPAGDLTPIDMSFAAVLSPLGVDEAYQSALRALPEHLTTHGMEPIGLPALREAVARRYTERGAPTTPDQILITPGAQYALRLILIALATPGDRVLVEHPTYPNALDAIRAVGGRPVPVPLRPEHPQPWDLGAIATTARQSAAKLAYFIPDYQNPTGLCLDDDGRRELVRIAREARTTLVIDEVMSELNLDGPQKLPVASFAHGSEVITIGSMSKHFWGGLRIGWIRAHHTLIARLATARASVDLGTPLLEQLTALELLTHHTHHLETRRQLLRESRAVLVDAIATHLPDWTWVRGEGGLSAWFQLPQPVSTALSAAAVNHGVLVPAGPRFGVDGAFERFVRLPFVRSATDLRTAAERLAAAYSVVAPVSSHSERPMIFV
ncbi:MAG: PLP-dependent aminotransferase family protein [Nocardiaceae bacterium]|nr:PLP-dependent aminotransferase family protein [Nocardiaceae bacterium]